MPFYNSTKIWIFISCFVLCNLLYNNLLAQDSIRKIEKQISFSGIVLPSRTPENGYLAQGGLVGIYKTQKNDTSLRASNTYLYGMYSQLHQWRISLGGDIFTPKEKLYIDFWYYSSYMPEKYFGIGNNTSADSSEFISYSVRYANTMVLKKLSNYNFAGLAHAFEYTSDISCPEKGLMNKQQPIGFQSYIANGIGIMFRHDSRDFILSAKKGFFTEVSVNLFSNYFFNKNDFFTYKADIRKYYHLIPHKDHILAFQLIYNATEGQTPLRFLPNINTRAYHPNLYRGKIVTWLQAEYRMKIWRWVGASFFGGLAKTTNEYSDFISAPNRPNYGGGLRFKLIPKHNMHLRIEYGFGQNTSNLYLAFYDAF